MSTVNFSQMICLNCSFTMEEGGLEGAEEQLGSQPRLDCHFVVAQDLTSFSSYVFRIRQLQRFVIIWEQQCSGEERTPSGRGWGKHVESQQCPGQWLWSTTSRCHRQRGSGTGGEGDFLQPPQQQLWAFCHWATLWHCTLSTGRLHFNFSLKSQWVCSRLMV